MSLPTTTAASPSDEPVTAIVNTSTLTCPECARAAALPMPTDACLYIHDCPGCGALLKPEPVDCRVFCSYGDMPCPRVQESRA